jgi:hypothetical protein
MGSVWMTAELPGGLVRLFLVADRRRQNRQRIDVSKTGIPFTGYRIEDISPEGESGIYL